MKSYVSNTYYITHTLKQNIRTRKRTLPFITVIVEKAEDHFCDVGTDLLSRHVGGNFSVVQQHVSPTINLAFNVTWGHLSSQTRPLSINLSIHLSVTSDPSATTNIPSLDQSTTYFYQ